MSAFRDCRREHEALGFHWLLDPKQLIDGAILSGGWEPATTAVVEKFVKPGMVACDVGANIGYYTLLMSRLVGPTGRVLAFEPMPEPRSIVEWHCQRNDVRNVAVLPFALDDRDENVGDLFFNYSWRGADPVEQRGAAVALRRLDTVVARFGDPNFLKIDVDGYEARLLRGARETLARFRPTMILEVCDYTLRQAAGLQPALPGNPEYGREVHAMLDGLWEIGYRFLWEESLEPVGSVGETTTVFDLSQRSINLVAVPA